ncbi:ATP-dependent Lon protease pim1 [Borealophlyctis nickersoniae]|nr:ATP-dependent Lon protease pim1 [Borealophlyctis nickersoniae]
MLPAARTDFLLAFSKTVPPSLIKRITSSDRPLALKNGAVGSGAGESGNSEGAGGGGGGNGRKGRSRGIREKESDRRDPENKDNGVEEQNGNGRGVSDAAAAGEGAAAAGSSVGGSGDGEGGSRSDDDLEKAIAQLSDPSATPTSLEKIHVPTEYPQLLAIPLNRRPLFPGFYKSLYIKDPQAIAAIENLMDRRQPYLGIFLTTDDNFEPDVITSLDQVHRVGVFAQITNTYKAGPDNSALTVVVYPHRRIRITDLVAPISGGTTPRIVVAEETPAVESKKDETQDVKVVSEPTDGEPKPEREPQNADLTTVPPPSTETTVTESVQEKADERYLPINASLADYIVSLANVENLKDEPYNGNNQLIKAYTSEMLSVLKEISNINPLLRDQIITFSMQTGGNAFADPPKLADFAAAVSAGDPNELQSVLESLVIEERLHKALVVLKKELKNAQLQQEIAKEVDKKITRKQQEFFLMEQLKGIKKELGMESDGKEKLVEKFKDRMTKLKIPEAVMKVVEEELTKLQHLEPAASEFNVTRNYLDWLTQIPWGIHSEENFDIKHATTVLDEDHYGLKDVKERILEFIAVGKLRGTVEGKIICLVGPPGVGKTSVGKSIARALGREFYRFSVGGLADVAEIKGHRRTYVGAMPGKVVQALKKVQTENPLIMIDEIDKLGRGNQGDPASALLELLDPEQNNSFLDHYMDVPIDLSKVLFVCTANTLDTIPGPLLDRMEIITLSGYVAEEKIAIAEKYLAPQAREAAGLEKREVSLDKDAIESLIRFYCRESGVRNLKKHIDKIYRKAAFKIVKAEVDAAEVGMITVTKDGLREYVGSPPFVSDRMYDTTPVGVVMGLAYTSMGGSALYIESVLESVISDDSKPGLNRTGQMGDVMKESSTIAYTYARALMTRRFPDNKFFDKAAIHLHVPEGATPKDGPSAGSTMTTSLLSLALNRPIIPNVAMTGEITLTGKILKIGGVKEKTIAAKRSGVTRIIFPAANRADWEELADYIKEGLEAHFVSWYDEILDIVLPEVAGKGEGAVGR